MSGILYEIIRGNNVKCRKERKMKRKYRFFEKELFSTKETLQQNARSEA